MSLTDASPLITAWRDRLLECPAVIALPMTFADFHYPTVHLRTTALPAGVLYEEDAYETERSGNGEVIARGRMGVVFYLPVESFSVGRVETLGRDTCDQLPGWTTDGLAIISARRERASKPRRAAKATAGDANGIAYLSIRITAEWLG